jgi:hypothetical protein
VGTAACGLSIAGTGATLEDGADPGDAAGRDGDDAAANDDANYGIVGTDAGSDAPPIPRDDAGCPTGRGPSMMRLFGTSSPALCIDETEVSSKQYAPFVADFAAGLTPAQSVECAAVNTSVVPLDPVTDASPPLTGDDPVDRIDHCDARLFCEWAGKHLCLRRDGSSAFIAVGEATDAAVGEWYAACSQDGTSPSVPALCNLASNSGIPGRDSDGQVNVTAPPPGGPTYAGRVLRHIVGNVEEWADGCDSAGSCVARGASVLTPGETDCTTRALHPRMERRSDLGFRCCAKPSP